MKNPVTGGGDDGPPYADAYTAIKDPTASAAFSTSPPRSTSLFQRIPKRYIMCVLILLSNILCYADRTNISIAVLPGNIPLADNTDKGQVLASFFYGYICTQLLGGILSIRYGGKPVLIVGVCLWVICDGLTVPASSVFPLLLMARIGMGLGEGVNFPADHAMVAAWFVEQERSAFLAIISAGVDIGTIVSSGLSPLIASQLGWKWLADTHTSTHIHHTHTLFSVACSCVLTSHPSSVSLPCLGSTASTASSVSRGCCCSSHSAPASPNGIPASATRNAHSYCTTVRAFDQQQPYTRMTTIAQTSRHSRRRFSALCSTRPATAFHGDAI